MKEGEKLSIEKVMEAPNLINARKAAGPSGVKAELLKVYETESIKTGQGGKRYVGKKEDAREL